MGKVIYRGFSFDDVLIVPAFSDVLPRDIKTSTKLTANIDLNIPVVSAAMDTVTRAQTAISMAREGGLGFIDRNLSIADQAREVELVKSSQSGMIIQNPITIFPDRTVGDARELMNRHNISGIPVVDSSRKLVGIITKRDLCFIKEADKKVAAYMTKKLITVGSKITLDLAKVLMQDHRIEKLLVINGGGDLVGLITMKDIGWNKQYPTACKDERGRLRVGAAVGAGEDKISRVATLIEAGVDVITIDTSHGHTSNVIAAVKALKQEYRDLPLIAGNVATAAGAKALFEAGADGVKVGIGPGSICTTRIVAGIGVPQISAIMNCAPVADNYGRTIIADGGIRFSGDITKAIAAGAHSVMIGGLFAGTEEAPGEVELYQGRKYKVVRGMGSLEAMKAGSQDRYYQGGEAEIEKLVPEGIVGRVPYRGTIAENIIQLIGGLKAGMGYAGVHTIAELRENAKFTEITAAGLKESHVHDVIITKESPNYRFD